MGSLKDKVRREVEAYNSGDWLTLEEVIEEDVEITEPAVGTLNGRKATLDFLRQQKATFPDSTITVKRMVEEGDTIVAEYVFAGTNTGPLRLPAGETVPATNKRLTLAALSIATVGSAGKIGSQRQYYDQVEAMTQLGLMPAASAAGA